MFQEHGPDSDPDASRAGAGPCGSAQAVVCCAPTGLLPLNPGSGGGRCGGPPHPRLLLAVGLHACVSAALLIPIKTDG